MNTTSSQAAPRRDWRARWRHLWLDESDAHRLVGREGLARLAQRVKDSERHHRGEIRVCIEAALPVRKLLAGCTPRQRAVHLFSRLGVGATQGRNGVLIYLLLADRAVEVVVDPLLQGRVSAQQWQPVVDVMQQHFVAGRYEQGLAEAIDQVDRLLRQHGPTDGTSPNPNELPDEPTVM